MIRVHPEVRDALADGRPVVALETAVLTTGLPRSPYTGDAPIDDPNWAMDRDAATPTNLACMRAMHRALRAEGAVPATAAVIDGTFHIGLADDAIEALALDENASKASTANLAATIRHGRSAGTTVSATLIACMRAEPHPIRVFATGGIGGVHRDWVTHPDISADLRQIASTPTCVVCSGAKSILDVPATVETLDTLGVPVLGYRTATFPQFYANGDGAITVTTPVDSAVEAASICSTHWSLVNPSGGLLLTNPVPSAVALDRDDLETVILAAESEAGAAGIAGAARTPFVLDAVARATGGRSLRANIALLVSNARLAASTAVALAE